MLRMDLERGMIGGTLIMTADLLIGFIATIIFALPLTGAIAGGAAFLELGILLVLGGCLVSRQPLEDDDRYNEDGSPKTSWKLARIGRQMLFAGAFLFIYAAVLAMISLFMII